MLATFGCALGIAALLSGVLAAQNSNVGDKAPTFTATDDQGNMWKSDEHVGKKIIVVYFYPADFTGGCTAQACGFRDNLKDLSSKNVEVVGVSGDSAATHAMFKKAENLGFTLLADEKGEIAKEFGIKPNKGGKIKHDGQELVRGVTIPRTTIIIGLDGRIAAKYTVKDAAGDSKKVLQFVQKLEAK
jgi:peroxiredoxin Q/BCP